MRLDDYWGIGPKTRELLVDSLGPERAIEAIEAADVGTLTGAGLPRGRVTRILRRATGGARTSPDSMAATAASTPISSVRRSRVFGPTPQ